MDFNRIYEDGVLIIKWCNSCNHSRPVDLFTQNKRSKDGYSHQCKSCNQNIRALNWVSNKISSLRRKAEAIGVSFNLTEEDIVIPGVCPVLGIPIIIGVGVNEKVRADNSPSVDRIIPALGYTKGNIVVVSGRANRLKSDATKEELKRLAAFYDSDTIR